MSGAAHLLLVQGYCCLHRAASFHTFVLFPFTVCWRSVSWALAALLLHMVGQLVAVDFYCGLFRLLRSEAGGLEGPFPLAKVVPLPFCVASTPRLRAFCLAAVPRKHSFFDTLQGRGAVPVRSAPSIFRTRWARSVAVPSFGETLNECTITPASLGAQ